MTFLENGCRTPRIRSGHGSRSHEGNFAENREFRTQSRRDG
jgi:hypothetical protein